MTLFLKTKAQNLLIIPYILYVIFKKNTREEAALFWMKEFSEDIYAYSIHKENKNTLGMESILEILQICREKWEGDRMLVPVEWYDYTEDNNERRR